jgi:hypothetical protein
MKLGGDFKGETFFMDDVKQETPTATRLSSFEVEELSSESEEDEVHEIHADSDKKLVHLKTREHLNLHRNFTVLHPKG